MGPHAPGRQGLHPGRHPRGGEQWLDAAKALIPQVLKRNADLGYVFTPGQRPKANAKGVIPTTMEWARKLTKDDIDILTGKAGYCEDLPDVDEGFTKEDLNEVKADVEGVVRAVHAENAQPVEFGQLLFELEPLARPTL